MQALKTLALDLTLKQLFVLTTVTSHWFLEQGFVEQKITDLPGSKKDIYNFTRNSKVFILPM
jgi:amino-acid N-acetyltransferase